MFVTLHIISLRRRQTVDVMLRACAGAMVGFLATTVALTWTLTGGPSTVLALVTGGLAFACLFVLYVPFFYTLTTSLSVATLILLLRNGGQLNEAELYGHFAGKPLAAGRLSALHDGGYIALVDGSYRATSRGRGIARFFSAIKSLLRLGPGG
jgi:hypothetical protein